MPLRGIRAFRIDPTAENGLVPLGLNTQRGRFAIRVPSIDYSEHLYCNEGEVETEEYYGTVQYLFRARDCADLEVEYRGETKELEIMLSCKEVATRRL